jgi:hypothetical protein
VARTQDDAEARSGGRNALFAGEGEGQSRGSCDCVETEAENPRLVLMNAGYDRRCKPHKTMKNGRMDVVALHPKETSDKPSTKQRQQHCAAAAPAKISHKLRHREVEIGLNISSKG